MSQAARSSCLLLSSRLSCSTLPWAVGVIPPLWCSLCTLMFRYRDQVWMHKYVGSPPNALVSLAGSTAVGRVRNNPSRPPLPYLLHPPQAQRFSNMVVIRSHPPAPPCQVPLPPPLPLHAACIAARHRQMCARPLDVDAHMMGSEGCSAMREGMAVIASCTSTATCMGWVGCVCLFVCVCV